MTTKFELQAEALDRAQQGQSLANYPAIIEGFLAMGISAADISPRENVFTFNAWKALGRVVRKGQRGVKVVTWVGMTKRATGDNGEEKPASFRRPKTTTVFHVSQTEPLT